MRRDLFDFDAVPEPADTSPAPVVTNLFAAAPPSAQSAEIVGDSSATLARDRVGARLRQARRADGFTPSDALVPLADRLQALRDRLAEGARKRPR